MPRALFLLAANRRSEFRDSSTRFPSFDASSAGFQTPKPLGALRIIQISFRPLRLL